MTTKSYMLEHYGHLLNTPEAVSEGLSLDATEALCRMMAKAKVSKAELARRMKVSKAYITQLLSGRRNMTLDTLSRAAFHCGHVIKVDYAPLQQIGPSQEDSICFKGLYARYQEQIKVTEVRAKMAKTLDWEPQTLMRVHKLSGGEWTAQDVYPIEHMSIIAIPAEEIYES